MLPITSIQMNKDDIKHGDELSAMVSVVVPVYNEQEVLIEFNRRLSAVREKIGCPSEIIFVNDGSSDRTLEILYGLKAQDSSIAIIDLSRNFGKEIAVTAGLDHARGAAVIIIDADLQDPPELIVTLIQRWREQEADV